MPTLRTRLISLPTGTPPDELWTLEKAAAQIGVNSWTVRGWYRNRKRNGLVAYYLQGRYYVQAREFLRWLDVHAVRV
jgi:DNA-binding transcriptional regulator YhcF (GntR family)